MNYRLRWGRRNALISVICLLLGFGLVYHEFAVEPHILGQQDMLLHFRSYTYSELLFHLAVPVILLVGWWLMGRTLRDVERFTDHVERVHSQNLDSTVPRNWTGDELDRLAAVFNEMTARLAQSFKHTYEFALNASHELKTPLTILVSHVETTLRETEDWSPAQREWLCSQLEELQRMARTVDSLTLITKADAGVLQLDHRPVDFAAMVRESAEDAQALAEPQEIEVLLLECAPAIVVGDRGRLRQLLLNLVDNATKYNETGGQLTISLRREWEKAVLCVSNTGRDVPEALKTGLFEWFVRGQEAFERGIEGSGLGLAICRRIVRAHHGEIELFTRPDGWTVARVVLPLAGERETAEGA